MAPPKKRSAPRRISRTRAPKPLTMPDDWSPIVALEAIRNLTLDARTLTRDQRTLCVDYLASITLLEEAKIARLLHCSRETVTQDLRRVQLSLSMKHRLSDARDQFLGRLEWMAMAAWHVAARKQDAGGMSSAWRALRDIGIDAKLLEQPGPSIEAQADTAMALVRIVNASAQALRAGPPLFSPYAPSESSELHAPSPNGHNAPLG